MAEPSRTTVYFERDLHRALKIKAAQTDRSISELVNEAVRLSLREDALDLDAVRRRRKEKGIPYEKFLKQLKKDGLI